VNSLGQAARDDMKKGEEVFAWTGRLSSSELALRFGGAHARVSSNPTGIGGNRSIPVNWTPRRNTPNSRSFQKFNCSSPSDFEMRFSLKGWPGRAFIRCARIAYHLEKGWHKDENVEQLQLLDQWPPTRKYTHADWLGWTQADHQIGYTLLEHCRDMKARLRDGITKVIADSFQYSEDPTDKLLWKLRADETRAFRECIALSLGVTKTAPRGAQI